MLKKIVLIILVVIVILLAAGYIFNAYGKDFVQVRLSAILNVPVSIGSIGIGPFGLEVKDLSASGYGDVKEAHLGWALFNMRKLHFSTLSLFEPYLVIQKTQDGKIIFGDRPANIARQEVPQNSSSAQAQAVSDAGADSKKDVSRAPKIADIKTEPKKNNRSYAIDRLIIKGGRINFRDYVDTREVLVNLNNIQLKASKIVFPYQSQDTTFNLAVSVAGPDGKSSGGQIEGRGWVNLVGKNMKAEFSLRDLDGRIFLPYYQKSLKRDLENGFMNLAVNMESKNNDMTVKCRLTIKGLRFKSVESADADSFSVEDLLLSGLQAVGKEFSVDFNFKTKMDDFKVASIPFAGSILNPTFEKSEVAPLTENILSPTSEKSEGPASQNLKQESETVLESGTETIEDRVQNQENPVSVQAEMAK